MRTGAKWQEWTSFALGLWLALSPWLTGYSDQTAATANAVLLGLALAFGSHLEVCFDMVRAEWLNLAAGLWLIAAPFTMDFGLRRGAITSVAVGAAVVVAASSAMSLAAQAGDWWHGEPPRRVPK